jgi:3-isopropylmalate/(R)-2-methylmalate dehydratase small subunit
MEAFRTHTGKAAALRRDNVDTDIIIPMKDLLTRQLDQLGPVAFRPIRYREDGSDDPDFILNKPNFHDATILVTGKNFGCGSSREIAVNAIAGMGFRVIIAPSFGDIFFGNCFKNGVLPIRLSEAIVSRLMDVADTYDGAKEFTVDLPSQAITTSDKEIISFQIDAGLKQRMINGDDDVSITLKHRDAIKQYQTKDRAKRPWIWKTMSNE